MPIARKTATERSRRTLSHRLGIPGDNPTLAIDQGTPFMRDDFTAVSLEQGLRRGGHRALGGEPAVGRPAVAQRGDATRYHSNTTPTAILLWQ